MLIIRPPKALASVWNDQPLLTAHYIMELYPAVRSLHAEIRALLE